jgi:hypothetical protein
MRERSMASRLKRQSEPTPKSGEHTMSEQPADGRRMHSQVLSELVSV